MKKILLIISEGFEEIETISIIDICRRAGLIVDICALEENIVIGSHNISIQADLLISKVTDLFDYEMIVLPGGLPNAYNLANHTKVQALLKEAKIQKKYIAAICAAPYALHQAGVLNKFYTCYPSFEEKIRLDGYDENASVVVDDLVITSRGPGTAILFALELVKTLCEKNIYEDVKMQVLV